VKEVTIEGRRYDLGEADQRNDLVEAINVRLRESRSIAEREDLLDALREVLGRPAVGSSPIYRGSEEKAELPLTWAQVREMEGSEWVSFGAHSMHHPILAFMADAAERRYEVEECRVVLEKELGQEVHTFAYPVGKGEDIGEEGLSAVRAAKYEWAVTTIGGRNTAQTDRHLLRRIVVDVDQHWLVVAAKASGVWDFLLGLWRCKASSNAFAKWRGGG
jgi:peptidoglycan/xylan/chitin deacetylase (PgdA/CDA1 family)